ncbi:ras-like protein family member 12 isoform X2 [Denticeps clupeoides]|uniref:ras-like protein family member 12 isoform X2 n=1 Tax=Denticeps clupeoides TaxID=299321 RepID=UPI0010A3D349|nr:ras-like protein family member 12 isoform X2 [Denticeps clupeoides]
MSVMFAKVRSAGTAAERSGALEVNIAVLGVTGSGKSALTVKFLTKRFIGEYDPSLEDTYSSEETVDQQPVLLKDGPVNCGRYLCWANAFIVVYGIDSRPSFEGCESYLEVVCLNAKAGQPEAPVVLLGNKVDMERHRQVSKAEGLSLASRFSCLFFEVSACLDFASVQHVFHEVVREVRREAERPPAVRPLFISEDKPVAGLSVPPQLTPCIRELPTPTTAKLVTVKSSRAQSKRRAPTLTLLKGFKIF